MEFKLALNYLSLLVKRKLSKPLEIWKMKSSKLQKNKKGLKTFQHKKVLRVNFQSAQTADTEPSPVSAKIIKKNRYYLQRSQLFTTFWKSPDKIKKKPVPVKPVRIRSNSEFFYEGKGWKENRDEVAVVSSRVQMVKL